MKKTFTQKIIVFVTLSLITAGFALAQNVTEGKSQPASKEDVVAEKEMKLERKKAEIEAKVAQKEAEIAEKVAQKEAEIAAGVQKQLEATQKQVQAQLKQVEAEQKQFELLIPEIPEIELALPRVSIPFWQHSGGGAVLVIPAAELKVEDLATITEDMTVMSRIFDNKLIQANLTTGRGSWFVGFAPFSGRDSSTIEAIYLEGYAALFLIKVNFPLSPPPEEKEEKETEEADADRLWTQTKQEMFEPEEAGTRTTGRQEEKYDAQKVAELKETLIKTLKHAANIRALKPDQSVILTVIGERRQPATIIARSDSRGRRSLYDVRTSGRSSYITTTPRGAESGSFLPTVLTICSKKSDIDAFAKGELSFDQFRERTRIFASYAKVGDAGLPGLEEQPVAKARPPVF